MKNLKTNEGTFSKMETILIATDNEEVIKAIEETAIKHKKKIFYAEKNSPDILAIPSFCVIGDEDFIGKENLRTFNEHFLEFKDKSDKTFLYLINEYDLENLLKKLKEAIFKMNGIYIYGHEKKYRISMNVRRSFGYTGTCLDVDDLAELKEIMKLEGAHKIDLGYYDIIDDTPNSYGKTINIEDINETHFEWLVTKTFGSSRYLEI